ERADQQSERASGSGSPGARVTTWVHLVFAILLADPARCLDIDQVIEVGPFDRLHRLFGALRIRIGDRKEVCHSEPPDSGHGMGTPRRRNAPWPGSCMMRRLERRVIRRNGPKTVQPGRSGRPGINARAEVRMSLRDYGAFRCKSAMTKRRCGCREF